MIFFIGALANEPCIPPPLPRTLAQFVLPVGAAPKHEDAIYTLIRVAPYGVDLHGWRFAAIAVALDGRTPDESLTVDVPREISGPLSALPARPEEPKAFWMIRIARPRTRSRIVLSYEYARPGQTPSGGPCENPPYRGSFPAFEATPE